jgi:hypothetical protein
MTKSLTALGTLAIVLTLMVPRPAASQTAPPTLQKASVTGGQRGKKVTITIVGTNIDNATRLLFSQPGFSSRVTGTKEVALEKMVVPKGVVRTEAPIEDGARRYELTAIVTIDASVPHGVYGFRLQTPLGISNQLRFAVSAYPEIQDREPNAVATPQTAQLPAALVGTLGKPGDVDAFVFTARAGEEMVFEVVSRALGARLDSLVRLLDESGATVAENNDNDLSRDSVLTWRFTRAGRYTLTIEDVEHGGGGDGFAYRVNAGALPYVTGIFPLVVSTRSAIDPRVNGVNLGQARVSFARAPAGDARTAPVVVAGSSGLAINRKVMAIERNPEMLEVEPNDDLVRAQKLTFPTTVNGRIWKNGEPGGTPAKAGGAADADVFTFSATKGQKLVFEVTAQQIGSPLDSVLEVLDASGRPVRRALVRCLAKTELALNDPDSNRRTIRIAAWNELAINDYLLVGDELLQVENLPTHPDDDIDLKGYRGLRTTLLDTTPRSHAVGDAVYKVSLHPPDARLEPNGMPVFPIDFVNDDGGSRFGGKDSRLHFEAPAAGTYFVRLTDVRGLEGERFAYRLTARDSAPDFSVSFDPRSFNIPRGGRVSVTVTAERRDGFDGPIAVELVDLPAGLSSAPGTIPARADTTVLIVSAAPDASLTGHTATLRSTYPGSPSHQVSGVAALRLVARATVDGREVTRYADVTEPLDVVALAPPPDLVVTTAFRRVEMPAGKEVELTVTVERHNGFTGRVPLTVMNLPHGVRVNDVGLNGIMIIEKETSRTMRLVAEPWVEPLTQTIVVVGRVEVNSPIRNEAAALPVELVVAPLTTMSERRR